SNSSPIPVPRAVIIARTSLLDKILSSRAFSTFNILPRSGNIAWKWRSRPCLADPPAESPSTIYSSLIEASWDERSEERRVGKEIRVWWELTCDKQKREDQSHAERMNRY